MRDKLIELIGAGRGCPDGRAPFFADDCSTCRYCDEKDCDIVRLADYLISHGATFADAPSANIKRWRLNDAVMDSLPDDYNLKGRVGEFVEELVKLGVTVKDNNVPGKPMTNGDRIRSMTDEELAEFILDKRENGTCFNNKCYYYDPNKGCDDCTLEWLKQPVR